jgi:hypothetical protein
MFDKESNISTNGSGALHIVIKSNNNFGEWNRPLTRGNPMTSSGDAVR